MPAPRSTQYGHVKSRKQGYRIPLLLLKERSGEARRSRRRTKESAEKWRRRSPAHQGRRHPEDCPGAWTTSDVDRTHCASRVTSRKSRYPACQPTGSGHVTWLLCFSHASSPLLSLSSSCQRATQKTFDIVILRFYLPPPPPPKKKKKKFFFFFSELFCFLYLFRLVSIL